MDESKKGKLTNIYNAGVETQKKAIAEVVGKKVEQVMPEGLEEKVSKAGSLGELQSLISK